MNRRPLLEALLETNGSRLAKVKGFYASKMDYERRQEALLEKQGSMDSFVSWLGSTFPVSPGETEIFGKDIALPCIIDWSGDAGSCTIGEQEVIHAASQTLDRTWLENQCKRIATAGNPFPVTELKESLAELLRRNPATIQEDLLNLLGFEEFEFIEKLLNGRGSILKALQTKEKRADTYRPTGPRVERPVKLGRHFATEWAMEDELKDLSLGGSLEAPQLLKQTEYPNVFGSRKIETFGNKLALPLGTVHDNNSVFEEFVIPYTAAKTKMPNIELVQVDAMENMARICFSGYKALNLVQSAVYETAYWSNENMLVSAPTGAGKTDVAMLAVLKTIRDNLLSHSDDPRPLVARDAFKIVYIAPMKALAAEIVAKFSKRLAPLGIKVREYTGDMQLTRKEIQETQMIVSTPEKWDVVTRKGHGDIDLVRLVSLLIIDEVHLLHDGRGPVLESIVARTLREVEVSQRMIRIVGLSATLPNYVDVAMFLRVNPHVGMFCFSDAFRPVPLTQGFIGIKGKYPAILKEMDLVCYERAAGYVSKGSQVMVFVHSRNETAKSAKSLIKLATEAQQLGLFQSSNSTSKEYQKACQEVARSRHKDLKDLFAKGFGIHHAGMIRSDRLLVERLFLEGHIKVLLCTATLAWGVNLPAHAVIIKGTQVYDSERGEFTNLGILDVLQIFGRAGRPQFETHGEGFIVTTHDKLFHYLNAIMCQTPIESQFIKMLPDNLNAEIALGTVSNLQEAVSWLRYTYLAIRMQRNPLAYGIKPAELSSDPLLHAKMLSMAREVALRLRNCGMVSFDNPDGEGFMRIRNVGRLASLFYLKIETIELFGSRMNARMTEEEILAMVCECSEFETVKVREDEMNELEDMASTAPLTVKGDLTSTPAKVSILIQAYICRLDPAAFSLQSDLNTIKQNAGRVFRAVFEIVRSQEWAQCASRALRLGQAFERRVWPVEHPIAQFELVPRQVTKTLFDRGIKDMQTLLEGFDMRELAAACGQGERIGPLLRRCVLQFPRIALEIACQPVLPTVLALKIQYTVDFLWDPKVHGQGGNDTWWLWIEDEQNLMMKYCEMISTNKKQLGIQRELSFYIPIDPASPPTQLYLRALSNRWMHAEEVVSIPLRFYSGLLSGTNAAATHTDLLPLQPLPVSALNDGLLESLYTQRGIYFFNAVQTQAFHTLYHGTESVLVGAPTGSGKTVLAELAMWNALRTQPGKKVVYIAPLKALVKERLEDWKPRLLAALGVDVVELTGDANPSHSSIRRASLLLTTPEKWDGTSRNWKSRDYVGQASLVILDEIHLLGSERGHVLEMLVTRMRRLAPELRIVGLSTAMANAGDLAAWLNQTHNDAQKLSVFNFRPSVRPVPLQVFIEGYAGQHYCPRMASMNKPLYTHILTLSPGKPILVFVSSRRQTRITAQALISHCVNDDQPQRFIMKKEDLLSEARLAELLDRTIDPIFRHSLTFGIAMHHAGMPESDRAIAEEAFASGLIQVMVATSTVAWGVNFPAHLVVVKGTEFYDAGIGGYRDLPVTDILQMIGRAGRPQFDTSAKAVILCQDSKKYFYKKFLYEPFPIESCLHRNFTDHLNAEIATTTVRNQDGALALLKTTYLGVRVARNPLYYGAEGRDAALVDRFFSNMIDKCIDELVLSGCVKLLASQEETFAGTRFGKVAAKYYLSHRTIRHFIDTINPDMSSLKSAESGVFQILRLVCFAAEFDAFPLRHNEDVEVADFVRAHPELTRGDPFIAASTPLDYTRPHSKVYVLIRASCLRIPLPFIDFETDLKIALEQAGRILAGLTELVSNEGWLGCTIDCLVLGQLLQRRCWLGSSLLQVPHFSSNRKVTLKPATLHELMHANLQDVFPALARSGFSQLEVEEVASFLHAVPKMQAKRVLKPVSLNNYQLQVTLTPENDVADAGNTSWQLLLGLNTSLIGRACLRGRNLTASFTFQVPSSDEPVSLFVVSEQYYGLDQNFLINLRK